MILKQKVASGIAAEFNHNASQIFIQDNYFEQNLADMSTGILAVNLAGTIIVQNNTFFKNKAITQNHVLIGAGVGIQIGGSSFTIVESHSNLFIYNEVEYSGISNFFFFFL